ncbi:MAG: hypothetical protein JNL82_16155 [Myxococcales bacterium]|nr:hypothetical protein [Myxococcales bacterium]
MLLDRHRVVKLIELAELEARVTGPERMLREEDVALLVKAAYDDATDAARAEFLRRVKLMPTSAWPWSAVQAMKVREGSRGGGGANVVYSPAPGALAPAALVLLRGQADGIDADPGNRVPERDKPEGAAWEPLHKALDLWDTATIRKWIGPLGWSVGGATAGQSSAEGSGAAKPGGGVTPGGGAVTPTGGDGTPNGSGTPGGVVQPEPAPPLSWRDPRVLAAGATVVTTVGVTLYALRRRRPHSVPLAAPPAASPAASSPTDAAKEST